MSALRNYRRSLSERRQSLSELYQQDAKRTTSESTNAGWQASSSTNPAPQASSSDDEDAQDFSRAKTEKSKEGRRLSLDFLFLRNKNKPEDKKKKQRSQSTSGPSQVEAFGINRQRKFGTTEVP